MRKVFKKNQIIITALALMIAVAGYLQYTGSQSDKDLAKEASADTNEGTYEISDEDMYSAEDIFTDTEESAETSADAQGAENGQEVASNENANGENPGQAVLTSTGVSNVDFVSEVKLNREQIRSQNKASLMEVINNANITEEQKQDAVNAMISMTDIAEREAAAEMLLEAKGFTDVVVSITVKIQILGQGEPLTVPSMEQKRMVQQGRLQHKIRLGKAEKFKQKILPKAEFAR